MLLEPRQLALIHFRPFLNSDPPAIAEIWRSQPPLRGRLQSVTSNELESCVLAKPYFDPNGLILATDADRIVGFVHAGFGPSPDFSKPSHENGVICLLMTAAEHDDDLRCKLLERGEQYLRQLGARWIYGGQCYPLAPFYLGLYGGSDLPGVLAADRLWLECLQASGYETADRRLVFQRSLADFRAPVDRRLMQARRQFQVESTFDPAPNHWWDACMFALADRTRFRLLDNRAGYAVGYATFWNLEPLARNWGVQATGLIDLRIDFKHRRQGLATFLLSEALRQLQTHGTALAEIQVSERDIAAIGLIQRLGFEQIDEGIVFRKPS